MIKLSDPYIQADSFRLMKKVIDSGNLVQNKYVAFFEKKLAEYLGSENVIVVSSGTAALHLSLIALGIKPGDEIILPAFTFPATANVVEIIGAKPVMVDIRLSDYCIDVDKIEAKITSKTKAIIPVHEFGQSADIERVIEIAKQYNLLVIEDAACALGTGYKERKAGTFGNAGCFSFHPRKAITTGEGGALVTSDRPLAEKIRCLRNHGIHRNATVDLIYPGFNYRMTDFQAALAIPQMKNLDKIIKKRIVQAELYGKWLGNIPSIKLPISIDSRFNTYQTYHILLNDNIPRNQVIRHLKDKGIEANYGAQALHMLDFYKKKYGHVRSDFINSAVAHEQGLALPIGMHLSKNDIEFIAKKVKEIMVYGF